MGKVSRTQRLIIMRIYLISALSLVLLSGCATAEIVDGEEDTDSDSGGGDPGATGGTDPGAGGGEQGLPPTGGGPAAGGSPTETGSGGTSPTSGGAPTQGAGGTIAIQPGGDSTCVPGVDTGDACSPGVDTEPCVRSTRTCECGADSKWACVTS
jgi:hypothetical protein